MKTWTMEPENIDDEPEVHSPVLSSTPVRRSNTEQDEHSNGKRNTFNSPIYMVRKFHPSQHWTIITASTTALDVFKQVFDYSLFDKIAEETNLYAAQKQ